MHKQQLDGKGGLVSSLNEPQTKHNTWTHINYTTKKTKLWLKAEDSYSHQAKTFLMAQETRPRVILEDEALIMCLRGINLNKNEEPEDMISIRIWLDKNSILTSGNRKSQTLVNVQNKLNEGNGAKNTSEFLLDVIEELALLTEGFIEKLDEKIDNEEDNITDNSFETFNPRMSRLRRQIATIKRYLAPQKESLEKLYRSKKTFFNEGFFEQLYVQIDKFMHLLENLDLMRERVLVLQEQFMAYISHQQNSRLYVLAIVSAIFLPLTFLSGLLGMNVAGVPGTQSPWAFWIVTAFCAVVTFIMLKWFKKNRWF